MTNSLVNDPFVYSNHGEGASGRIYCQGKYFYLYVMKYLDSDKVLMTAIALYFISRRHTNITDTPIPIHLKHTFSVYLCTDLHVGYTYDSPLST